MSQPIFECLHICADSNDLLAIDTTDNATDIFDSVYYSSSGSVFAYEQFGGDEVPENEPKSDDVAYDVAARSISSFLILRMDDGTTNNTFADVQAVCARTRDVKPGSRVPSLEASGATRQRPSDLVSHCVVLLAALLCVFMVL